MTINSLTETENNGLCIVCCSSFYCPLQIRFTPSNTRFVMIVTIIFFHVARNVSIKVSKPASHHFFVKTVSVCENTNIFPSKILFFGDRAKAVNSSEDTNIIFWFYDHFWRYHLVTCACTLNCLSKIFWSGATIVCIHRFLLTIKIHYTTQKFSWKCHWWSVLLNK